MFPAFKLKHPQSETCSVLDPTDIDFFLNLGVFRPQGSRVLPQRVLCRVRCYFAPNFERFDCQVERANWIEFSQSLNKFCECDSLWKSTFGTSAVFLWCQTHCCKKARWRTLSYRCRQYFPPVVLKMCRIQCLRMTSSKIWKSPSRCKHQKGYRIGLTFFRCLIENPQLKENIILKIDFENDFNSINRQFLLEKTFEIHPEVYKYSNSSYS